MERGPWESFVYFLSRGKRYQLDALAMLLDACHHAGGKFEGGAACGAVHARLFTGAHGIDKGLELGAQRFNGRRRQLFKGELRLRTRLFHGDAQRVAPGVIERDVFMLLEESYLADSFCGNAARRDIGDCAAGELEPGMRDVHFVAQNRNAHGLHLGHWLLDQGEQNVEIVNHQVIDNIHIQAARCEYSRRCTSKNSGWSRMGSTASTAGLNRSRCPTCSRR